MSQHPVLNVIIPSVHEACKIILRANDRLDTIQATEKSKNDFVSEVDKAVEALLIDAIKTTYPDDGILGEESGEIAGKNDNRWIIDPLDGTRNFLHGYPQYCISIALQQNGKTEHALICDPVRDEMFTATRGKGARLNNRRIRVSQRRNLDGALLGTGLTVNNKNYIDSQQKIDHELFLQSSSIRRSGTSALDLAYIAAGRLDGFWKNGLQIWDMAAGALLIQEAGGLVSDFNGSENYLETGHIVAGNPKIFKAILQTSRPVAP